MRILEVITGPTPWALSPNIKQNTDLSSRERRGKVPTTSLPPVTSHSSSQDT